jgi:transposase
VTITQGQRHEMSAALELLEHARGQVFIADTGYDSDAFVAAVRAKKLKPVIHPHPCRKTKRRLAREFYAIRYRVECFFHDLKRFRAVATRYEKSAQNYLALVHVACAMLCSLN